jgi:hypothetical protein
MLIFYSIVGKILTRGNRSFLKKTCPSATLSTTQPTGWTWYRNLVSVSKGWRITASATEGSIQLVVIYYLFYNSLMQAH